ncbi:MAG: 2Fe-2S iron-sulfur cluster-binding protein [Cyclobacteriaceae bacterium]
MPKIVIENLNKKEIFSENEQKSLLDILHENYVDWMHACGGKGRCTTCKAIMVEGIDNLSPVTSAENKYIACGKLKSHERLACQCQVWGDLVIRVDEANKFMHLNYSE